MLLSFNRWLCKHLNLSVLFFSFTSMLASMSTCVVSYQLLLTQKHPYLTKSKILVHNLYQISLLQFNITNAPNIKKEILQTNRTNRSYRSQLKTTRKQHLFTQLQTMFKKLSFEIRHQVRGRLGRAEGPPMILPKCRPPPPSPIQDSRRTNTRPIGVLPA